MWGKKPEENHRKSESIFTNLNMPEDVRKMQFGALWSQLVWKLIFHLESQRFGMVPLGSWPAAPKTMGYSNLSEWKAPISPNFQNFVGAPISPNCKWRRLQSLRIFKIQGILTFFFILSCKNTVFTSNLIVQLKTAGYNTLGWVF